jgi:hypothetical protein
MTPKCLIMLAFINWSQWRLLQGEHVWDSTHFVLALTPRSLRRRFRADPARRYEPPRFVCGGKEGARHRRCGSFLASRGCGRGGDSLRNALVECDVTRLHAHREISNLNKRASVRPAPEGTVAEGEQKVTSTMVAYSSTLEHTVPCGCR